MTILHCQKQFSMGCLCFCTSCKQATNCPFVSNYLCKDVCIAISLGRQKLCLPLEQRVDFSTVNVTKIMSPSRAKSTVFLQPIIKDLGFLSMASSAVMQTCWEYSIHRPFVIWVTLRNNANDTTMAIAIAVNNKTPCLWSSIRLTSQLACRPFTILDAHMTSTVRVESHNSFHLFLYSDVVADITKNSLVYTGTYLPVVTVF